MRKPLYCCNEYLVDSDGFIISKRNGTPMKPSKNPGGYMATTIIIDGRKFCIPIHLAVARTFLGDRTPDGLQVNHIDGNPANNRLDNLEWVTPSENMRHSIDVLGHRTGGNNPHSKGIVGYDKITNNIIYSYDSIADCAKYLCGAEKNYRYVQNCIWRVLKGYRKTYKGCYWKYKDDN